jgi:hypothetical protein
VAQSGGEWRVQAGGGSSTFKFQSDLMMPDKDVAKAGFGGNLGVDYTYFFSPYFGFSVGMELAMYNNSIASPNTLFTEQPIETPPGLQGNFFLRTQYDGITEKQTAVFLQLPVMLRFQLPMGKHFFYLAAGGKYGMPLSASYTQTISTLTTTGYSDDFQQIFENMPNHGFETQNNVRLSDNLKLTSNFILAVETGMKWQTTEKSAFYTGIYLDAGYAMGIKIGFAFGGGPKPGRPSTPKAQSVKPQPLWGD